MRHKYHHSLLAKTSTHNWKLYQAANPKVKKIIGRDKYFFMGPRGRKSDKFFYTKQLTLSDYLNAASLFSQIPLPSGMAKSIERSVFPGKHRF